VLDAKRPGRDDAGTSRADRGHCQGHNPTGRRR
jgi:hypothetical protein